MSGKRAPASGAPGNAFSTPLYPLSFPSGPLVPPGGLVSSFTPIGASVKDPVSEQCWIITRWRTDRVRQLAGGMHSHRQLIVVVALSGPHSPGGQALSCREADSRYRPSSSPAGALIGRPGGRSVSVRRCQVTAEGVRERGAGPPSGPPALVLPLIPPRRTRLLA